MDLMQTTEQPEIVREREALNYTKAEQDFSLFIQQKLHRLLKGDDNDLMLFRRLYNPDPQSLFLLPWGVNGRDLRQDIAEEIVAGVLRFLDPFAQGGPVAQDQQGECIREVQVFPTQHPHIIVQRTDLYDQGTRQRQSIEWKAVRLQNQRKSTLVNRAVDLGILAFEIARR